MILDKLTITVTLSWQRPLLYKNQSIDLLRKWFLYDNGFRHEEVNEYWKGNYKSTLKIPPNQLRIEKFKNHNNILSKNWKLYTRGSEKINNLIVKDNEQTWEESNLSAKLR